MIRSLLACLLALLCVASASAQQTTPLLYGSNGNTYRGTYPDLITASTNITSATTTQLIAPSGGTRIFIYWLGMQASASNTTPTFQFEYSTQAACASGNTTLTPVAQTGPTTTGNTVFTIGGGMTAAQSIMVFTMASVPFVIPPNNYLCVVTAGGSVAAYAIAMYAQHT